MFSNATRGPVACAPRLAPIPFPGQGHNGNRSCPRRPSRSQEVSYSSQRHLSPEETEQIVAGYLAGTTAQELLQT